MDGQNPVPAGCPGTEFRYHRRITAPHIDFRAHLLFGNLPVGNHARCDSETEQEEEQVPAPEEEPATEPEEEQPAEEEKNIFRPDPALLEELLKTAPEGYTPMYYEITSVRPLG